MYEDREYHFPSLDGLLDYVQECPDGKFLLDCTRNNGLVKYFFCSFGNKGSGRKGCPCRRTCTQLSSISFTLFERQPHHHFGKKFSSSPPLTNLPSHFIGDFLKKKSPDKRLVGSPRPTGKRQRPVEDSSDSGDDDLVAAVSAYSAAPPAPACTQTSIPSASSSSPIPARPPISSSFQCSFSKPFFGSSPPFMTPNPALDQVPHEFGSSSVFPTTTSVSSSPSSSCETVASSSRSSDWRFLATAALQFGGAIHTLLDATKDDADLRRLREEVC